MGKKWQPHRVDFIVYGESVCFYDMSDSHMARVFLEEAVRTDVVPGSDDAWLRMAIAIGYTTGRLKIPVRYRKRIREAILRVRLEEGGINGR